MIVSWVIPEQQNIDESVGMGGSSCEIVPYRLRLWRSLLIRKFTCIGRPESNSENELEFIPQS